MYKWNQWEKGKVHVSGRTSPGRNPLFLEGRAFRLVTILPVTLTFQSSFALIRNVFGNLRTPSDNWVLYQKSWHYQEKGSCLWLKKSWQVYPWHLRQANVSKKRKVNGINPAARLEPGEKLPLLGSFLERMKRLFVFVYFRNILFAGETLICSLDCKT